MQANVGVQLTSWMYSCIGVCVCVLIERFEQMFSTDEFQFSAFTPTCNHTNILHLLSKNKSLKLWLL